MLSMRFARRFICTVVLCACLRGQGTDGNQKAQHKNVCINCTCYDQHKNKYNLWPLQNLDDPENPRFVSYYIIRNHTKLRRRRQRERQKRSNLMSNTKALHVLHAFLQLIFLAVPAHYDMKSWPNFNFTLQLQPKFPSFKKLGDLR